MKLIVLFYQAIEELKIGLKELIFYEDCSLCKGSNGNCDKCKHNENFNAKNNLFKRDWNKRR